MEKSIDNVIHQTLEVIPLTFKTIQAATEADPLLKQVQNFVHQGWPNRKTELKDPHQQQFFLRRDGLSIVSGCLTYGERLVIPAKHHKRVLQLLHKGHPGVERMRSIARNNVYWPGIDDDITQLVRSCDECASVAKTNPKTNLASWPTPANPWQRVHMDYAGPIDGWYFLILVDAFSKWPEVVPTKRITTEATLAILRGIFARFGMPETLVSDNGRQFVSEQFERFCDQNGILHLKTPPFHPQSNGLAERFVDTFKRTLKKITAGGEAFAEAINTFLLVYRSTPCRSAPENKTPAALLLGRPMRTSLDLLKPPAPFYYEEKQQEQQFNRRHGAKARSYDRKELVWTKVFEHNNWKWEPGEVIERVGRVIYNVWLTVKQNLVRSHCNQLRKRFENDEVEHNVQKQNPEIPLAILLESWGLGCAPAHPGNAIVEPQMQSVPESNLPTIDELQQVDRPRQRIRRSAHLPTPVAEASLLRHSSRTRRAPVRYGPYQLY